MPYAIDKQHTLDLVGGSTEYEYDVGAHAASRTAHVVRATSGTIQLGTWPLAADGTFTGTGAEVVVGHGSRTRIVVFDNDRIVVLWIDASGSLRARGYNGGGGFAGAAITVETLIADFDVAYVGVTTGVQHGNPQDSVYYAYRNFAFTTTSANGGWKLWFGTVTDNCEVSAGPVAGGGPGDKVALSCASVNEIVNGTHPRKALTLWRDAGTGQIKTESWRVAGAGVTPLASAAETKPLGVGIVHGMSAAQGNDMFATVVWPGASNATARLQLISLDAGGAMSVYGSAEIAEIPRSFAPLQWYGGDAAVAYTTPEGHVAVAAWRFAAPASADAPRTVLAAQVGTEQPTNVRLASLLLLSGSDADPVTLVTLSRVAAGLLRLVSWRLHKTVIFSPIRPTPISHVTKP